MKKWIILIIAVLLMVLLIACASSVKMEEGQWYGLSRNSKTLGIQLDSNPTTGYQWTYELEGAGVGKRTTEYKSRVSYGMAGVGGEWKGAFSDFREGETAIVLKYERSWEKEPVETRVLVVTAERNGRISSVVEE